ncbi:MAG: YfaZ family protein [Gammaproteobacteria bacterium]|nr:YfaZ family protein [Gammaproteobacteria bacterium]
MLRKALIFILAIAPLSTASAAAIDFRLGGKMAEVMYKTQDASFGYGGADMGLGLFINENDDLLVSGSILVSGSSQGDVRGLHFGVGAKIYAGILDFPSPVDNQNGGALAIGAQVRYVFPGKMPIAILLEGFGAPNVTSVSDFKGIKEIRLALEIEITPSARAYIGYRSLEVDLSNGLVKDNTIELDDRGHVGVRFAF